MAFWALPSLPRSCLKTVDLVLFCRLLQNHAKSLVKQWLFGQKHSISGMCSDVFTATNKLFGLLRWAWIELKREIPSGPSETRKKQN